MLSFCDVMAPFHYIMGVKCQDGGLDIVVDNALACHVCDPDSNPGKACGRVVVQVRWFSPGSPVSSTTFEHLTPTSAPSRRCI